MRGIDDGLRDVSGTQKSDYRQARQNVEAASKPDYQEPMALEEPEYDQEEMADENI